MESSNTEDIGFVTEVTGNRIRVEIDKGGGCKHCGMKGFCGTHNHPVVLHFDTDGTYHLGDRVRVSVTSGIRVLSALLIFAFPLLALFGAYYAASFFLSEKFAVLVGFGGLIIAFLIVKMLDKCIGKKINFVLEGKVENLPQ